MLIGLVRHGETSWNAVKRIQGQTDIPLNESGLEQAKLLGNRLLLEDKIWDFVITSDLQRAYVTGESIAAINQIPMLSPDDRLRERFFGEVEGTTLEDRIEKWGEQWRELDLNIESDEVMAARGLQLLDELYQLYPEQNILCVTHGSFIAVLLQSLFPGLEDVRIENLSYTIINYDGVTWKLQLHGCIAHLA